MNNISIVGDLCCGCESCSQVCAKGAIVMKDDECGFSYPIVCEDCCIKCGKCTSVCPVLKFKDYRNKEALKISFAAYAKNDKNLLLSSSGGVGFEIMQWAFNNEYKVFGVRYSADFKSTLFSQAICNDDLECFRGTKYIQSRKGDVFRTIKKYLELGDKVLFVGLPCEVAGLKEFVKPFGSKLVCVELICHGPTSKRVSKEYVERIQKEKKSNLAYFTIRRKVFGWTPGCIFASFKNGKTLSKLFDATEYGFAFRNLSRKSCYSCRFKGEYHPGDILIGDYWGASIKEESWNKNGVSIVFLNTEKGKNLYGKIDSLVNFSVPYDNATKNNSSIFKSRDIRARNKYVAIFIDHDIFYARKKLETPKQFLVRHARNARYLFKKRNTF